MFLLAIDLETTGLDPQTDQILEVGAVATELGSGVRHEYRMLISHSRYQGQAYALWMNQKLFKEIADLEKFKDKVKGPEVSLHLQTLEEFLLSFQDWVIALPFFSSAEKLTLTGKNVGSFDLQFLKAIPGWNEVQKDLKIGHRCLDPGPLYFQTTDQVMPDLSLCLKRAGIKKDVEHTALADCYDVINVIEASSRKATHLKTGNYYNIRSFDAINATNDANGEKMVIYQSGDGKWFSRRRTEFEEKFGF